MIEKMRKYAFMVRNGKYDSFLKTLREVGVVHVNVLHSIAEDTEIQENLSLRKHVVGQRRTMLQEAKKAYPAQEFPHYQPISLKQGLKKSKTWDALLAKRVELSSEVQALKKDMVAMEVWGDFEPDSIKGLEEKGWKIDFWRCNHSAFRTEWEEKYNVVTIEVRSTGHYFVSITPVGTHKEIDAEEVRLPEVSYTELERRFDILQREVDLAEKEIQVFAFNEYNAMGQLENLLKEKFNLLSIHAQTERVLEDHLLYLEGWIPEGKILEFEKTMERTHQFFEEIPTEKTDRVPIKLKNNFFSKLFEPIVNVYSLPNYFEIDPTPFIAPFFMLFFGLCFGDGGYGLLVFLACCYFKRKVSKDQKPLLSLFMYLSGAAIVVGVLTGSFFGVSLAEVEAFASLKERFITSDNLMTFSIAIGLVQIVLGKAVAAYKTKIQEGTRFCIAPFAWVVVIASLSLWFGLPYFKIYLPASWERVFYGIAGGAFLVTLFYNAPGKNIFLNVGKGLYGVYEMASGLLGDTLSYIRLFALGLTGSILGSVFNSLAFSMGEGMNPVAGWVVTLLILAVGHTINFGLCMISSLVHPLRLIFVEYYKNSAFEGGGKPYAPYQAIINEEEKI